MVKAGRLRNRIILQKRTDTADAAGQPQPTWADQFCRWSQITPLRGSERIQAMQLDATLSHKVMLYWDSETSTIVPGTWRVKYKTRYLDINAVIDICTKSRWLELHCTEAV